MVPWVVEGCVDGALSDTGGLHAGQLYRLGPGALGSGKGQNPDLLTLRLGTTASHRLVWALRRGDQREARATGEEHDIY